MVGKEKLQHVHMKVIIQDIINNIHNIDLQLQISVQVFLWGLDLTTTLMNFYSYTEFFSC